MLNKSVTFALIFLLLNFAGVRLSAATGASVKENTKKEAKIRKHADKVKQGVYKLGAGKDSVVNVKLRDKTKISGYVSAVEDETFTVTDQKGASHVIPYTNTKQIKGNNLHKGVWIGIGVGIGVLVIVLIVAAAIYD